MKKRIKISKNQFSLFFFLILLGITQKVYSKDNICFEILRYSLTQDCDRSILPEPVKIPELVLFFNRSYFDVESRRFYSYIDKYFPEEETVIESSGFYAAESDSGLWIDQVLFEMEEERLAAQIEALNEEGATLSKDLETSFEENQNPEIVFTQRDASLSAMEFEDEIFIVEKDDDKFIKISSNALETLREFYDSSYKLLLRENWEIKGVENSKLKTKEEFFYENGTLKPHKKILTSEKYIENFLYNTEGLTTSYKKYIVREKGNKLLEKQSWKYDSENRILSYIKTSYTYKDDTYKKLQDSFEQKKIYTYNEWENIPPDEEYYEDKVLKQRTKYSQVEGTYTTQFFFENDFAIKTYYKNNEKLREVYTLKGEVWRVKEYEKK